MSFRQHGMQLAAFNDEKTDDGFHINSGGIMKTHDIFSGTVSLLERALDLRSKQHNRLVSNVVNQDTPNYRAFDTAMEDALHQLSDSGETLGLARTHPGHLGTGGSETESSDFCTDADKNNEVLRADGNTVDIERTMVDMASNTIMYNAMTQIISKKFSQLRNVIIGGKA